MYSDRIVSYSFYKTDFDEDIYADETYMGLNRYLQYKNGGETVTITDGDYSKHGAPVAFLGRHIEAIIAGDADAYNAMFSDEYFEENEPHAPFTMQKLYNIVIEQLSMTVNEDGSNAYSFDVGYCMRRNNGTFRNDVDSDSTKKLRYELIERGGEILIDSITYIKPSY